ncbi:DUF2630 family protein [Aeromicrobium wangtongii]|uniref:DUF2630 family protein n=1 Tax=Aeromicrobium wangtongii TaxID=2969247 RepID=A0ABY5M3R0_9ACTN|nr:DUF2630 family protein [Aeromicrobium wangtongii]MCD9198067.1 DUF2630 family protein [Aeromicrobium wangtongii]MCL3819216.1 DUF2630 family protein [Aeromicrobium wangtongii]UUP12107.1 DUF2630 family protein [Aeromicrobium wangtongii]
MTTDQGIHEHINSLVAEEKRLREQLGSGDISRDEERTRLRTLEVELDQAWDLLRQRRALRETGGSEDDAAERSGDVVENYLD